MFPLKETIFSTAQKPAATAAVPVPIVIIMTVAGSALAGRSGDGGLATSSQLNYPEAVAVDASGNIFIADKNNHVVRMVAKSTGIITTVAGTRQYGYSGDGGQATVAQLRYPQGVAVDVYGNIYIADTGNHRIRMVTKSTGIITTVAGSATSGFSGDDGQATLARLLNPQSIAIDASGNIYIADTDNRRIRVVIKSTGIITTWVGNGQYGFSGDRGYATYAAIGLPQGIAVDTYGNIYFADAESCRILVVSMGRVFTVVGNGECVDDPFSNYVRYAKLRSPRGVAVDTSGNIYISDGNTIRMVTKSDDIISTIAGSRSSGFSGDGDAPRWAGLNTPLGIAVDTSGNIYIADAGNNRIRKVGLPPPTAAPTAAPTYPPTFYPTYLPISSLIIMTVAGGAGRGGGGDGGLATTSQLDYPAAVAVDDISGDIYIADKNNHVIRMVAKSTGIITTVAGNGMEGYGGDGGQAMLAQLRYPQGVAVDTSGNLYIADTGNHRIRVVTKSTGFITTVAGSGRTFFAYGDHQATTQNLHNPQGIAVDASGNIYIADTDNYRIRVVTKSTGVITVVAGNGDNEFGGDGRLAKSVAITLPQSIAVDAYGNIYIADTDHHRIRKITKGMITTVAGNGQDGNAGDGGQATSAQLRSPRGVAVDASGNIYISDVMSNIVRMVTMSTGIISTVAGSGSAGFNGDGDVPRWAHLNYPLGITLDSSGNLYIADTGNNRVRKVCSDAPTAAPTMSPTSAVLTSTPAYSPINSLITISTVAGGAVSGRDGDGGLATTSQLDYPAAVAVDATGNIYIADQNNHVVRMVIKSTGIITTVAGNGQPGYGGDRGQATAAQLRSPRCVAVDVYGNIYIADTGNHRIRKVTKRTGSITTVAGSATVGFYGDDGQATLAQLRNPQSIAIDASGNIYIADTDNLRIRVVIKSTGIITTVVGNGQKGFSGDGGHATSAVIAWPQGIAVDTYDNIYIADADNRRIRKVTKSTGVITTVAGNGVNGDTGDGGQATLAQLSSPRGVAVDASGNIYISDFSNKIRMVTKSTNIMSSVAGNGWASYGGDGGVAREAQVANPLGIAVDTSGNLYIADAGNNRIRKVGSDAFTAAPTAAPTLSPTYPPISSLITITTVAGGAGRGGGGDEGLATSSQLDYPAAVAVDASGNIYIADKNNHVVRMVAKSTGIITIVAGDGMEGYGGDGGQATVAQLRSPQAVAVDAYGNIYIADTGNRRIRVVTKSTGIISTVAGDGLYGSSGDGSQATLVAIGLPLSIAVDASGNIYIADTQNRRIRKVTKSTGIITTVVGNGQYGFSGDGGQATSAKIGISQGIAVDAYGNIYIADTDNYRIRKVTKSTGVITTVAGNGQDGCSGDGGQATSAQLSSPRGVAVDASGNIFISDIICNIVRMVTMSTGIISTVAGSGSAGFSGDGDAPRVAQLNAPVGIAVDTSGNLYIADSGNNRIRKVGSDAFTAPPSSSSTSSQTSSLIIITTVAGGAGRGGGGNGGLATSSQLNYPGAVAVDASGNIYIADKNNHVIRMVAKSTGIITTVAGNGMEGYGGDGGQATLAQLRYPQGVAVDAYGNIYIADTDNRRIRMVTKSTGFITTVAGNGQGGFSGDGGQATSAAIGWIQSIAVDASGNIYIADTDKRRIGKVTKSTGIITTVAGTGQDGFSGDRGYATSASMGWPQGIAVDALGNIYIADADNRRIRKVTKSMITTVAGNGEYGNAGDGGQATSAQLSSPKGVAVDASGNIYISDDSNIVRMVTRSTGIISTVAGSGSAGFSGDGGVPRVAQLNTPRSIAVDSSGNLYIADTGNNRIRKVGSDTFTAPPTAAPTLSPTYPPISSLITITTVAGGAGRGGGGNGGLATSSQLNYPAAVAVDASGNIYIADTGGYVVRMVAKSTGIITTVAGNGMEGYGGDRGQATLAQLRSPQGVAVDAYGNIYILDSSCIRMVTKGTGIITTVTCTQWYSTQEGWPKGLAVDASGVIYIADTYSYRIGVISKSTGIITTVAGTRLNGFSGDGGQATSAKIGISQSIAVDASGNIYIADTDNYRIRKVTKSTGVITTVAGNGEYGNAGDGGQATSAQLSSPRGVAVDASGNIYISDFSNFVRMVTRSTGIISTVAGSGSAGFSGDGGVPRLAQLNHPLGIAVDSSGNLYIADTGNSRIRMVRADAPTAAPTTSPTTSPTLIPTAVPTSSPTRKPTAQPTSSPTLSPTARPTSLPTLSPTAQPTSLPTRKPTAQPTSSPTLSPTAQPTSLPTLSPTAQPTSLPTISPTAQPTSSPTLSPTAKPTSLPTKRPTKIPTKIPTKVPTKRPTLKPTLNPTKKQKQLITTIAGNTGTSKSQGGFSGDGGLATTSQLDYPGAVVVDALGNIYIADQNNHVVRMVIKSTGIITTVAGNGQPGYGGDRGQATAAQLRSPRCVAVDVYGNIYIADTGNHRIRKVTKRTGSITTVAGSATVGFYGDDGQATLAQLRNPQSIAIDASGNIYIADTNNCRIRVVIKSTGIITTAVGTGQYGFSGDRGQATVAQLGSPQGVAVDAYGNIYIADPYYRRIRKVTKSTGIITIVAGDGQKKGFSGDGGQATSASMSWPQGIAVDAYGNIYIADAESCRIRKVTKSTGIITTVAGTGQPGYSGDGDEATVAQLRSPQGVAVDTSGNLYIADAGNNRIRKIGHFKLPAATIK